MSAPSGDGLVGGLAVRGEGGAIHGIDARTGAVLAPDYPDFTAAQVDAACRAAAASGYGEVPAAARGRLLRAVADGIHGLGDALLQRCEQETALPRARLEAERARTVNQLRMFAALVEAGDHLAATIDRGDPSRQPLPKPDLRSMLFPLGPVAVFGASNFPFAYSVAGGDTASALAAGCPVVVKAHPAHPGTSELVGRAVVAALQQCGLPAGAFALVHGHSHAVGSALVRHPAIAAVGFTGSPQGGRALCDLAAARPCPIPVYAEMGSANPVFVLPAAMAQDGAAIAARLVASATAAVGQMCTCPGLVFAVDGPGADAFAGELRQRIAAVPAGNLVHASIRDNFARAQAEVEAQGLAATAQAPLGKTRAATEAAAVLYEVPAAKWLQHDRLHAEVYGPALLLVRCRDLEQLHAAAAALHGHLTGTVHGTRAELAAHAALFALLRQRVGRLVCNGVPTGVEVVTAMMHGGPWPASSNSLHSAVGATAIRRFLRPVCFQDAPPELLPEELRDGNPRGLWRTVDGVPGRA